MGNYGSVNIVHLKQVHKNGSKRIQGSQDFKLEPKDKVKKVVFAQFHIAQYVLKNIVSKGSLPVVVSEAHAHDSDVSPLFKEGVVCKQVKEYFPSGLNMNYDQLNAIQGELLWAYGGDTILFCSKSISKIYAADTVESKNFLQGSIKKMQEFANLQSEGYDVSKPFQKLMNETMALQESLAISLALKAHEDHVSNGGDAKQEVFLIYGAAHDFKEECALHSCRLTEVTFNRTVEKTYFGFQKTGVVVTENVVFESSLAGADLAV